VKYNTCCGRDETAARGGVLKPAYRPCAERDPAYWRALKAARNRFSMPRIAWEDPRTVAALLGLSQRAGVDLRRAPEDEDFDALIAQLERGRGAGAAHVWMQDEQLVFGFAFDEELTAAIERLPKRRFDTAARVWTIPATPASAVAIEQLLDDHPWLEVSEDVSDWLDAQAILWSGLATVVEGGGGPHLALYTLYGEPPAELLAAAIEDDGRDPLLLSADANSAALLDGRAGLQFDAPAAAALRAVRDGQRPTGARLAIGYDAVREERFELRTDWGFSSATAFSRLPEAAVVDVRADHCAFHIQKDVLGLPADPALAPALRKLLTARPDIEAEPAAARRLEELKAQRARRGHHRTLAGRHRVARG